MKGLIAFAAAVLWSAVAFAQHFEQIPDFRSLYDPSRNLIIGPAENVALTSGDWDCIWIDGNAYVPQGSTVDIRCRELVITPTGSLQIGLSGMPFTGSVTVTFADGELLPQDTAQWGKGLLCFGRLHIFGKPRQRWIELAGPLPIGTATLPSVGSGWEAGDELRIADTRRCSAKSNIYRYRVGTPYTLLSSSGQLYSPVAGFARESQEFVKPIVINCTNNIIFQSENPAGVRGHAFMSDAADVDCRHFSALGMGRTLPKPIDAVNRIGRYAWHLHHLHGQMREEPSEAEQYVIVGALFDGVDHATRWGAVTHRTHWGRWEDCVAMRFGGAGFATEDGNEIGNKFKKCLAYENQNYLSLPADTSIRQGFMGSGYWLKSVANVMEDCVAINNEFGFTTATTAPESPSTSTPETLVGLMSQEFPGGPMTQLITPRQTTLSFKRNRAVCNNRTGYDAWGSFDTRWVGQPSSTSLEPTLLPTEWEDSVFAYNARSQVFCNNTMSSILLTNCKLAGGFPAYASYPLVGANIDYRRHIYLDDCTLKDNPTGTATGRATIVNNTEFLNVTTCIKADAVASQRWPWGLTRTGNTYSGTEIIVTGPTSGQYVLPPGFTADDIPPCAHTLAQIRANVAAYRQTILGN